MPQTIVGLVYGSSSHIMHMNEMAEKPTYVAIIISPPLILLSSHP